MNEKPGGDLSGCEQKIAKCEMCKMSLYSLHFTPALFSQHRWDKYSVNPIILCNYEVCQTADDDFK